MPIRMEGVLASAPNQPSSGDRIGLGATWTGRDPRRAVAGEASDAMDARGLNGFGEGHGRQDGGEPPRQHRFTRPRRSQEKDVMVR